MLVRPFGPNVDSDGDWSEDVIKSDKSTAPRGDAPPRAQDNAADTSDARRREHDIDESTSSTSIPISTSCIACANAGSRQVCPGRDECATEMSCTTRF